MKADKLDLLLSRTSPPIHELVEPAPSDSEIERIVSAAIRVPDHGRLAPWRFILFRGDARVTVGQRLAALAEAREGPLSEGRRNQELSRFSRAPLVIGIVSCTKESPKIPDWEMFLSGGAAAMNLLNAVHALGYKGNWITNWYSDIPESRGLFGLAPHERIVGFVHIGTHQGDVPERPRPAVSDVLSEWVEPTS